MPVSLKFKAHCVAFCLPGVILILGSVLPIWTQWSINDWEGVGYRGTLWQTIAWLPSNMRHCEFMELLELHSPNIVFGVILLAITLGAGLVTSRRLQKSIETKQPSD